MGHRGGQQAVGDLQGPADAVLPGALDGLRVLIAHEWLITWGGSERCIEQLVTVFPTADLVVGMLAPEIKDLNDATRRAMETWLGRVPGARRHHRWFIPLQALAFGSLDTSDYDLVISSSHAFAKAVRPRPDALHVCYCHSPPRYLWHLSNAYRSGGTTLQRLALRAGGPLLRRIDVRSAAKVDHFIANSRHIADRIHGTYGRAATVVYPPVAPKPGVFSHERGDFLLSLGRLVPYKRVDLTIRAAERLGIPLVVAGDGPERRRLERLAGRHTEFVGEVAEEEAGRLLSTCAAFVFCAEEDFGIAPVEANAHRAPVVGYRAGGLLESMVEGETAEFFERQTVEDVASATERALSRSWEGAILEKNAARFSPERFRSRFRDAVLAVLRDGGRGRENS
jgi:glycosyltransferase involved in cell wall biosynthesis